MIDIHTHILPFIDDGSKTLEESIKLLEEEARIGVTDVFLTPHYIKHRNYLSTYQQNKVVFDQFLAEVQKRHISVNLHLGNEVYYHFDSVSHLRNQTVVPMGCSKFVLIEFSTSEEEEDIAEAIHNMKAIGLKPIIAHIERYPYLKNFHDYELIKKMGAYIQVNASSVTGSSGGQYKKLAFKLIKAGLVDFIASDIHTFRKNELLEAYQLVEKKFGNEVARHLFHNEIILK